MGVQPPAEWMSGLDGDEQAAAFVFWNVHFHLDDVGPQGDEVDGALVEVTTEAEQHPSRTRRCLRRRRQVLLVQSEVALVLDVREPLDRMYVGAKMNVHFNSSGITNLVRVGDFDDLCWHIDFKDAVLGKLHGSCS